MHGMIVALLFGFNVRVGSLKSGYGEVIVVVLAVSACAAVDM
jgi:hypothetical protein